MFYAPVSIYSKITILKRRSFSFSGTPPHSQETGHVANDYSSIDAMCEVTGGRSYAVTSHRMLHQCIDSLVQKLQSGVVIHFEKIGPDPVPPSAEALESELQRSDTADTVLDDDADLTPLKVIVKTSSNTVKISKACLILSIH